MKMNHFNVSMAKSALRGFAGAILLTIPGPLMFVGILLIAAEILGILEECV